MSGSNTAGVTLPIRLQANGVKEGLEAIGQAGKTAFDGIAGAAGKTEQSSAALQRAFARTQAVLDPAAAAAEKYALQVTNINRAEEAGLATAQRAAQLREAATAQRDRSIARIQAETAAMLAQNGALSTQAAAVQRFSAANDQAASSARGFGGVVGQAGFQVQDFVTQVQMGQNALMAFGVQGAQLLGAFGTGGAIAGALLVFGTLAAQMVGLGSAADTLAEATDAVKEGYDRLNDAAERRQRGLQSEAEAVALLAEEYRGMGLAAARAETLLVERRGAALDLEAGRMREALQGTLSSGVLQQLRPRDATNALGEDLGLARVDERLVPLAGLLERIGAEAGQTQQNIRALAAEADRLAQAGGSSAQSFTQMRDAALDLLPAAAQLDQAQRQLAVQAVAAAEAMGNSDEVVARYAARFGSLATEIMNAGRQLNALRQGGIGIAESAIAGEIRRNEAVLAALRSGGVEAGRTARDAGTREEQILKRASDLAAAARREMEAAQVPLAEIQERLREAQTEYLALATRAVDSGRQADEGLRPARDGARGTAAAVRDIAEAYVELRREASSGLLLVSEADARTVREVSAQLRGTALDPAARRRAEAEAERTAEREAERRQSEADRFSQNWGDRLALETTRGIFEGTKNGETAAQRFGNAFRNILLSSVSSVLSRQVFQPIISSVVSGGSGGGLSSLFGGSGTMGGAGAVADAGGMQGGLNQAGQLLGLRSAGGFGNLGNAFTGNGLANTGFAGLDGLLNTQVVAPSLSTNGMIGAGGIPIVDGSAGLSAAGAIGGAASIAGGAYGVYQGLQRGGIGGYTSAAGGALSAGLGVAMLAGATIPVAGWVLAGLLAIAGAALPGQQQSGRGQLSRINLNTDNQTYEGLGGDRFSQGNRDAASSTVASIADMARRIGDQLGGARIGGDVAVGVTSSRGSGPGQLYLQVGANTQAFANDEAGSKQLAETAARLILEEFKRQGTATGDYAGILAASPTVEVLSQNLEWYEKTYKVLTQATEPVSAFQQSIDQLTAQFQPAIDKARELGLSVDAMTAARERELQKLRDERATAVRNFGNNLDIRTARAVGDNRNADLLAFDVQAEVQMKQARAELEALGLTAEEVAGYITRVESTLATERLAIVTQYANEAAAKERQAAAERQLALEATVQAGRERLRVQEEALRAANDNEMALRQRMREGIASLREEVDAAFLGSNSPLTGQQRFALAQQKYERGQLGLNEYLGEAKGVFGSATSEYAGLFYGALDNQLQEAARVEEALRLSAAMRAYQLDPINNPNPQFDTNVRAWWDVRAPRPQGEIAATDTKALTTLMQGVLAELRSGNSVRVNSSEEQADLLARMTRLLASMEGKAQLAAAA
ncbi:hypothetical protein KTR66_04700 [Roseococcus sp. SDR]|uniref:hypothetical protein n=1 Tax=Roseococcus sp. SDR TaxID=2835532 RepID=UPI001BCD6A86|nr:hypothetical protein [Roseococcus sp. SDR]MBS7789279.1 hypothetical protein [Roseococcus sp. SDR]MBV1844593.1 hypothetical protein [Roseococcus sp. SDR]